MRFFTFIDYICFFLKMNPNLSFLKGFSTVHSNLIFYIYIEVYNLRYNRSKSYQIYDIFVQNVEGELLL